MLALGRAALAHSLRRNAGGAVGGVAAVSARWSSAAVPQPVSSEEDVTESWKSRLGEVRTDWSRAEVEAVYGQPLLELVHLAGTVHRAHHDPLSVQKCTLLSIKTGGCPEDCTYCSQSSKHETDVKATKLMGLEEVYEAALRAKAAGSTRFCMGAAWRGPSQVGKGQWERVKEMVSRIRALDMEVCTTMGMLTDQQAKELREAGLSAYNHNLDTSEEHYAKITSTRKYQDRLDTLAVVRNAGISVCAGGIIGLGEGIKDRAGLLLTLATLPEHPESVPINKLVAIEGTPLGDAGVEAPSSLDFVRCIATARILMPKSMVRLSAGRTSMSLADQALCFMSGANSIFSGDQLLTTPNPDEDEDSKMFEQLGLHPRPAFLPYKAGNETTRGEHQRSCGSGGSN